jgi:predicted DNA-binding transcriptional regulator YafY
MAVRPDAIETVKFVLEILRRIPRHRKVTAQDIHKQLKSAGFERDLRTVQRQLESLSLHFDIDRDDRSKPYGYRWNTEAGWLALSTLTAQESVVLTLAEQYLKNLLPEAINQSMASFFNQAKINLSPTTSGKKEKEWLDKVLVVSATQPLLPPAVGNGILESVSDALYDDKWLEITYQNSNGKTTESMVMPLGLAQQGPSMYLVCRFKGYDDERILALHRMQTATAMTLSFDRPTTFNLKQYDQDRFFGFGEGREIKLTFTIEKRAGHHLYETPLSRNQTIEVVGDDLSVTATLIDSEQLDRWLLSFGDNVRHYSKTTV